MNNIHFLVLIKLGFRGGNYLGLSGLGLGFGGG